MTFGTNLRDQRQLHLLPLTPVPLTPAPLARRARSADVIGHAGPATLRQIGHALLLALDLA